MKNLVVIPIEDLQSILTQTIEEVITKITPPKKKDPLEDLPENLTRKQTAKVLNICLSKVDQLAKEGRLTKYRNGTVVRFKKSEILNFYQSFSKYQRH